jgi:type VI secretion system protein ImpL
VGQGGRATGTIRDAVTTRLDLLDEQLVSSTEGTSLKAIPVVFFVGRPGTTKSSVLSSEAVGARPVGQDPRGREAAELADAWMVGRVALVELAGSVFDDQEAWAAAFAWFRPSAFRSRVLGDTGPAKKIVACVSSPDLLESTADGLADEASRLSDRLEQASDVAGVPMPVNVLFTKLDALPDFEEFAKVLLDEDAQGIVGVTKGSGWAEDEVGDGAVNRVRRLLSDLRSRSMARHGEPAGAARAFNFVREFGKTTDSFRTFLDRLSSSITESGAGEVRGFYFTGVRPVTLREGGTGRPRSAGATDFFVAAPDVQAEATGPVRVPDWVFLRSLIDRWVAFSYGKRNLVGPLVRRAAWGLSGAFAVLAVALFASFMGNRTISRSLERQLGPLAERAEVSVGDLELLRAELERLQSYRLDGRPARLGFGLYADVFDEVAPAYQAGFATAVAQPLVGGLRESLSQDATYSSARSYGDVFEALRTYMTLAAYPDSADVGIARVMRGSVSTGIDHAFHGLFERQLAFFATLPAPRGDGLGSLDTEAVASARRFLGSFAPLDAYRYAMVRAVPVNLPDVGYDVSARGRKVVLRSSHVVPGAYSRGGWEAFSRRLDDPMVEFVREAWVSGRMVPTQGELAAIQRSIRDTYLDEFLRQWTEVLASARFVAFDDSDLWADAERTILAFLAHVITNTSIGEPAVDDAFEALRLVVSVDEGGNVEAGNALRPYLDALPGLDRALTGASSAERNAAAAAVRGAVDGLAASFPTSGRAGEIATRVKALLEQPVDLTLGGG